MKVRVIAALAALATVALVASGCTNARAQLNMKQFQAALPEIEVGKTKIGEIEASIGPAMSITPVGNSLVYAWVYSDSKTRGLTLILLNISKTNTGFDVAHFRVRPSDNVIEGVQLGKNSTDVPWEWWAFGD